VTAFHEYDVRDVRQAVFAAVPLRNRPVAADEHQFCTAALSLHAGIGCEGRGKGHEIHLAQEVGGKSVEGFADADTEILMRRTRLRGCDDRFKPHIEKNGVRAGTAGIYSQTVFQDRLLRTFLLSARP